jgi:hypothetical protein
MLTIQEILRSGVKLDELEDKHGICVKYHPELPIVLLDYDMINSVKTDPAVMECRGLCLHKETFEIIQKSFTRFFNFGEYEELTSQFNWNDFSAWDKIDGSMIKIRWYNDDFLITTRFSFADAECGLSGKSWRELVLGCLDEYQKWKIQSYGSDDCNYTFVFEFCSPWNQVVKYHETPQLYLLGIFIDDIEISQECVDDHVRMWSEHEFWCFARPKQHHFKSDVECFAYLDKLNEERSTDEGFVLIDSNGLRLKIKNKYYVLLHSLNGNGEMTSLKKLLPVILNGEIDEIISYFPHLKDIVSDVKMRLDLLLSELLLVWDCAKDIESQKDFANKIIPLTKMSSILFKVRKAGGDIKDVGAEFKKSEGLLIKIIDIDL